MKIKLSEISIIPITPTPKGIVAFCNFVINKSFKVCDCAIATDLTNGGFRIIYPIKKIPAHPKEKTIQIFYPINQKIAEQIQTQIIIYYNSLVNKFGKHV